ncbi:hypothetical protein ABZ876_27725 [Streptomyces sp. NPDC046931]|uniref:hypothetical protein n=1 Tax=Streptomyces sp. NPDC046931 TaxID=3154806 RepID=UPI0033DFBB49
MVGVVARGGRQPARSFRADAGQGGELRCGLGKQRTEVGVGFGDFLAQPLVVPGESAQCDSDRAARVGKVTDGP